MEGSEVGREHLDGDVTLQVFVPRAVDHAHPAFADLFHDPVMLQGLASEIRQSCGGLFLRQGPGRAVQCRRVERALRFLIREGTDILIGLTGSDNDCTVTVTLDRKAARDHRFELL